MTGRGSGAEPARGTGTGTSIGTSTDIRADRRTDPGAAGLAGGSGADGLCQQQQQLSGTSLPGALANPTPGTIVVHFNGKVQVDVAGVWTSVDNHLRDRDGAQPHGIGNATTVPAATLAGRVSRQQRHRLGEGAAADHRQLRAYLCRR